MNSLPERMRELREDNNLKQSNVAEYLGTTQQYYSNYETGKYELPSRYIKKLADLYGVSADYLLGRTNCPDGVNRFDMKITDEYTADKLLAELASLSPRARESVIEYIKLWKDAEKQNN